MTAPIIGIAIFMVLLTSVGQLLLKKGANTSKKLIFNSHVILGYVCFVGVILLSAFLMSKIDFKYFSVITGLNFMATTLLAALLLKEHVSSKRYLGCFFVAAGSILFSF